MTTTIILNRPIKTDGETLSQLVLRAPTAGDLRGVTLRGLMDLDINAMLVVVPRLSMTPITPDAMNNIAPSDLVLIGGAIAGFFADSPAPSQTMH